MSAPTLRLVVPAAPPIAGNGLAHLLHERRRLRRIVSLRPERRPIPLDSIRARGRLAA